ncbi:MAG: hypothetical protein V4587_13690 [Acidobacteriota bacterium]
MLLVWLSGALYAQSVAPAKAAEGTSKQPNQLIPEVKIPVVPLGFMPPGDLPAFYYYAMVELHFIDADHLLFAFNTPGLLKRDDDCPDSDVQRLVRADVFQLPSGRVLKQVDWKLYDFMDFLWGIGDGKLLLRRCNRLESIGADLDPQVLIQAVGKVEDVSFSPDRSIVVVQERVKPNPNDKDSGSIPSVLASGIGAERTTVSFIHLNPLRMIGRAQIELPSAIPLIANGLIEVLTAPNDQWVVNLRVFQGNERQVASIHSLCPPLVEAISDTLFMARTCSKGDKKAFEGYDLHGSLLWQIPFAPDQFYPRLIPIPNSSHFAIESLRLKHPRAALDPLTKEDVGGEDIDIYDTHSGVQIATFQTLPAYTGGQNVDFSPDGTRMAVLHDGAIEIYTLSDLMKALPVTAH